MLFSLPCFTLSCLLKKIKLRYTHLLPLGIIFILTKRKNINLRLSLMNHLFFSILSHDTQMLFAFAEWLGYSPSRHVILTTYPRQQLSDVTQTFSEAGLAHDTALVLEEI